jgi:hypothetical protein
VTAYGDIRETVTRAFAATLVDPGRTSVGTSDGNESDRRGWDSLAPVTLPGVGDVVDGTYRLVRVLGIGNFGRVYVAERLDIPEHQVALKILPRSHFAGRNVERELVMLATVGHPNVVQLKDHGATSDYVWLTMPVYEGETLESRLERGTLGFREAHDIFVPIARGLEALHAAGLRHQDIKPENLFLARFAGRLHPILLDLGVAVERDATFVAGTALFASPEQLLAFTGAPGAIPLTDRMDCYCLGTTVLLALVGEDHFPGWNAKTRDEIAECHATRAEDPLETLAIPEIEGPPRAALEEKLKRWMALDPKDRPSMKGMAQDLDVLLEPEREAERNEERAREKQRRQLSWMRMGAIASIFGMGVLGAIGWGKRETLRLASALDEAKAEGQERFGDLRVCTASYGVARGQLVECLAEREQEKLDHQQRLAVLAESGGESCDAAIADKTYALEQKQKRALELLDADFTNRINSCETAHQRTETQLTNERDAMAQERAELETLADQRAVELEALQRSNDQCQADRASCLLTKSTGPGPTPTPAPAPTPTPASP